MQINQDESGNSDRKIHEKYEPPLQIADDEPADDGPEHRPDQARNGHEAHGADKFGFVERPHQSEPAHRDHHGAPETLQDATGYQQMDVARYAAKHGPEGKETDRRCKYPARSEPIRHPAADR